MELIADIFLAAGAIGAGLYCFILGRRLNRFNDLEKGVGGAVAVLSAQVDDLTRTLATAQETTRQSGAELAEVTKRAEGVSRALELQVAALHDIAPAEMPEAAPPPPAAKAATDAAQPLFTRRRDEKGAA